MIHIPSLNFGLGETVDLLRDAVRDFAQAEIAPMAAEIDGHLVRVAMLDTGKNAFS